ncbi:MAG: metallophosphoesterase, partial [Rhodoferax sp.]|nr:metallophosphoesterase [Rhodoferax sp.]
MRLALLSDIHANLQALDSCVQHARAQGADRFAFLGDMVGYGADPAAVLDRIQRMTEDGALVLKGNHDEMAHSVPAVVKTLGESSAAWTHYQLKPNQRQWLAERP